MKKGLDKIVCHRTDVNQLKKSPSYLQNKPVNALAHYESILKKHPHSPRAIYGRAHALDLRAELERSNPVLEQAIDGYLKLLEEKDVPKALMLQCGRKAAERQSFRGKCTCLPVNAHSYPCRNIKMAKCNHQTDYHPWALCLIWGSASYEKSRCCPNHQISL